MTKKQKEYIIFALQLAMVIMVVILFKTFIISNTIVKQNSMNNTLLDGDILLLSKYDKNSLKQNDIIVLRNPDRTSDHKFFVKRVIGLEKDMIEFNGGMLYLNDELKKESYVSSENNQSKDSGKWLVPENNIFVLGDNRDHSIDSRQLGFIPKEDVVGKAFFRVYPFSRFGKINKE